MFIIDAVDRPRFTEAKNELHELLELPELAGVPMLILLNKIDIPNAASEAEMRAVLELSETGGNVCWVPATGGAPDRPMNLFPCSILRKVGYKEGFQWLSTHIS